MCGRKDSAEEKKRWEVSEKETAMQSKDRKVKKKKILKKLKGYVVSLVLAQ